MTIEFTNLPDYAMEYALPQIAPSYYPGSKIGAWFRTGEHFKIMVAVGLVLALIGIGLTYGYNQPWGNMYHISGWVYVSGLILGSMGLALGYIHHYFVNKRLSLLILVHLSTPHHREA